MSPAVEAGMADHPKARTPSAPGTTAGIGHSILARVLYALATIQLVWAYHSRLPSYLRLDAYENGLERTPFQSRILMMLVLRWAHHNPFLIKIAEILSTSTPIYRSHIQPEAFVLATMDTMGVVLAGWVATRIYEAASERRLLTAYVYPLVLVFCATSYILLPLQPFRFYYDLPSLGFFSVGLYLIYFRKNPLWFAALFVIATINRETTLMLLWFFVLAAVAEGHAVDWRRAYAPRTLAVVVPLALYWTGWHIFVGRMFAHNHLEWIQHYVVNAVLLAWPPAWPQMLSAGCFLILPILVFRRCVKDATLRIWLWALPAWFGIMFVYGILVEVRIFGELIPYLACMAALIAEQTILGRIENDVERQRPPFAKKLPSHRSSLPPSVESPVYR
ncbi:MAG: hypothetical protein ACYDBH_08570 [Acidobacteriaceae bacterium]